MDGARAGRRRRAARIAAETGATKRRCPRCQRGAALSARVPLQLRDEPYVGWASICHYCGHEVGWANGQSYGRDVTPEPGARGGRLLPLDTSDSRHDTRGRATETAARPGGGAYPNIRPVTTHAPRPLGPCSRDGQ